MLRVFPNSSVAFASDRAIPPLLDLLAIESEMAAAVDLKIAPFLRFNVDFLNLEDPICKLFICHCFLLAAFLCELNEVELLGGELVTLNPHFCLS